jgi:carbonic anhydrase
LRRFFDELLGFRDFNASWIQKKGEQTMNTMREKATKLAIVALLTALLASTAVGADRVTSVMTLDAQAEITPTKALTMLKEGNARFVSDNATDYDYKAQINKTATGQFPFACVLSCLDSRIIPEIIFDRGIGDLFVARVAGNFTNDDILGSFEFATKFAGSKVIVVMGHSECGAVKGACDFAQLGLLSTALASINPAVTAVEGHNPRTSKNAEFVQAVSEMNVRLTMKKLLDRSVVLRQMVETGEIDLVGAMYDIRTGEVVFLEE